MIRILRLLKIMKVFKQNATISNIVDKLQLNAAFVRMIAMLFVELFMVHIYACFWFLASKFDDHGPDTWVGIMGLQDEDHST